MDTPKVMVEYMPRDERLQVVGDRLKRIRRLRDYSHAEAAQIAGISRQALINYENGSREIKVDALARLARFYDVDANWLLGLTDTLQVET